MKMGLKRLADSETSRGLNVPAWHGLLGFQTHRISLPWADYSFVFAICVMPMFVRTSLGVLKRAAAQSLDWMGHDRMLDGSNVVAAM